MTEATYQAFEDIYDCAQAAEHKATCLQRQDGLNSNLPVPDANPLVAG
jgi:hypothetical protein